MSEIDYDAAQDKWDSIPPITNQMWDQDLPHRTVSSILAKRALSGYSASAEPVSILDDILADLRHLCDVLDLDFEAHNQRGLEHYLEDREEDHERFAPAPHPGP